jgi:hypothetical protein
MGKKGKKLNKEIGEVGEGVLLAFHFLLFTSSCSPTHGMKTG